MITTKNMWEYKNGNYTVRILDDGTKFRLSDNPVPEYPESIDVKITNKCNAGCAFCHERSTPDGKSFDVNLAYKLFSDLPGGVELAIGGGNPLECRQDFKWLLRKLSYKSIIMNVTLNAIHLPDYDYLNAHAVGISYRKELHDEIKKFCEEHEYTQTVIHLIAGVHTVEDLERCLDDFDRVLILGYKIFGRGVAFYNEAVERNLDQWKSKIGLSLHRSGKIVVFDNLSLEQLNIKRFFSEERWRDIYMGDDGQFTMYLDLVEKKYAKSSRSEERFDIGELTIKDMFKNIRTIG